MANGNYSGMTLNERLFAAGVLDQFDTAISERNREKVIELLMAVEVENHCAIANSLLDQGYQCWFCGDPIERGGRQALGIGLSDLWSDQCDGPPTQMIYAHFDCAEKRMEGSSMALERDVLFPTDPES